MKYGTFICWTLAAILIAALAAHSIELAEHCRARGGTWSRSVCFAKGTVLP